MKEKIRHIFGILTLVMFLGMIGGSTLCYHTHELEGHKFMHSHPFLPGSSHNHSTENCIALAHIAEAMHAMMPTAELSLPATPEFTVTELKSEYQAHGGCDCAASCGQRAPPSLA